MPLSQAKEVKEELLKFFYLPPNPGVYQGLDAVADLVPAQFRPVIQTFRDSAAAVVEASAAPFAIAFDAAIRARHRHFQVLDVIDNDDSAAINSEDPEIAAKAHAARAHRVSQQVSEDLATQEGKLATFEEAAHPLIQGYRAGALVAVARELLLQGTVGLWSCVEILTKDTCRVLVNHAPALAEQLFSDATAAKYFEPPRFKFGELALRGFNLSTTVGDVIFEEKDFSDLRRAKSAILALLRDDFTRSAYNSDMLWNLCQERHLIVHRRGRVDRQFLSATGRNLPLDSVLEISPSALEQRLSVVLAVGTAIAQAVAKLDESGHPSAAG